MSMASAAARACGIVLSLSVSLAIAAPPKPVEPTKTKIPFVETISSPDLLADESGRTKLLAEQLAAEVQAAVSTSRETARTTPEAAVRDLKDIAARVAAAPELSADVRASLRGKLSAALRAAQRAADEREESNRAEAERRAASAERQAATRALDHHQERLVQLTERLGSLLDERSYAVADEIVAPEIAAADPGTTVAATSASVSALRAYSEADQARRARERGVTATLYQVELSHMPQPDDPPIVYVAAPVWQDLTERRKRYAASDLSRRSPAEEKIAKALDDNATFEFREMPLADALEVIKDAHGIEIQFDRKALEDAGISTDVEVNLQLRGISLRSALRLLLNDLGLAYQIKHEVLLITTPDRVASDVATRVYPVEDLVVPIRAPSFGGGFGPLNGMNQGFQNQQDPFNNNLQNGQNNNMFQRPGLPF